MGDKAGCLPSVAAICFKYWQSLAELLARLTFLIITSRSSAKFFCPDDRDLWYLEFEPRYVRVIFQLCQDLFVVYNCT